MAKEIYVSKNKPTPDGRRCYKTLNDTPEKNINTKVVGVIYGYNESEAEKNAAYVATACNSHDELVEALKKSMEIIDRMDDEFRSATNKHSSFTKGEYNKLNNALAKATQK